MHAWAALQCHCCCIMSCWAATDELVLSLDSRAAALPCAHVPKLGLLPSRGHGWRASIWHGTLRPCFQGHDGFTTTMNAVLQCRQVLLPAPWALFPTALAAAGQSSAQSFSHKLHGCQSCQQVLGGLACSG